MKTNILTLKQFTKYIEKIKLVADTNIEINNSLKKINDGSMSISLDFSIVPIVELLEFIFDDKENGWIEYWIWQLKFGVENHKYKVYDNDKEISLITVEDLYNLLIDNMKEK